MELEEVDAGFDVDSPDDWCEVWEASWDGEAEWLVTNGSRAHCEAVIEDAGPHELLELRVKERV